ncbi:MAG: hypothetical protein R3338_14750 [Thermoanaerobaculia bacterium]|nr:hypothetical protein [Thermoanaerobaculia bacterium]
MDPRDSESFPFTPSLVELGGRIYVIGSEVSMVPKKGMVRRLRVHEIEPVTNRRRAVTRR